MSVNFARTQGERLAKQFAGPTDRVDVAAVAENLGICVLEAELGDGVSGLLVRSPDQKVTICVQKDNRRTGATSRKGFSCRQRFSIAHELGHHMLGHQFETGQHVHVDRGNIISQRGPLASQGVDAKEIEANQFAASLLMPAAAVRSRVMQLGRALTDQDIEELARTFDVSEQAMTIRLSTLRFL